MVRTIINFFFICLVNIQFIACQKDVSKPSDALSATATNIAGAFTINSFVTTADQTAIFNGFTITFNENGAIVATRGSDTFNGTWMFDDGNNTEIKINFSNAPLNQLNKGWHIANLTEDHLLLTHDGKNEDANDDHSSDNSSIEFERD